MPDERPLPIEGMDVAPLSPMQSTSLDEYQQEPVPHSLENVLAARNLLRSRVRLQEGQSVKKKGKSVEAKEKPSSVFERLSTTNSLSQRTETAPSPMPMTNNETKEEAYRWTATKPLSLVEPLAMPPDKMKLALKHERTPEMRDKLEHEACEQDEWSRISNDLQVPQLVKQMALNASMKKEDADIILYLRASQKHLHTEKSREILQTALNQQLGIPVLLSVEIGNEGVSPLEWRDRLYADKLSQATEILRNDLHVRFICQRFSAEIDEDSIRPI